MEFAVGKSGEFMVEVDGNVLWDRKQMSGQFPDEQSLVDYLASQSSA